MTGGDRQRGRRGYALLLVLWTLVFVALLVTQIAAVGRHEARIAQNLTGAARAQSAADGAVFEAVFRLLDRSARHWPVDGASRRVALDDGSVMVRIESETGKLNPNLASPTMMAALLQVVGMDGARAEATGLAIAQWRQPTDTGDAQAALTAQYREAGLDHAPPGEPYQSLAELDRVIGVTPALLAALRPHLSLYSTGPPDPAFADPVLKAALARLPGGIDSDQDSPQPEPIQAVTITAEAQIPGAGRFVRRAVFRLGDSFPLGYQLAEWETDPTG